jgi:hypothetical protein
VAPPAEFVDSLEPVDSLPTPRPLDPESGQFRARFARQLRACPSSPPPAALRDFIRDEADWEPGTSAIIAAPALKLSPESPGVRWGDVVKHPDGRVELIPVTAD